MKIGLIPRQYHKSQRDLHENLRLLNICKLINRYSNLHFQHFHRLLSLQIIGMNIKSTSPQKDIRLTFWELLLYVRYSQLSVIVSRVSLHRKHLCCPCFFSSYLMEYRLMETLCQSLLNSKRWEC